MEIRVLCPCGIWNGGHPQITLIAQISFLLSASSAKSADKTSPGSCAGSATVPVAVFGVALKTSPPKLNDATNGPGAMPEPARETHALPPLVTATLFLRRQERRAPTRPVVCLNRPHRNLVSPLSNFQKPLSKNKTRSYSPPATGSIKTGVFEVRDPFSVFWPQRRFILL